MERLTEAYLAGVVALAEYQRRRQELETKNVALERQVQELGAHVTHQAEMSKLAVSIEDFCRRVQTGLAQASFEQKRKLVELLIDRVVVINDQIEVRYVVPTDPRGETTRFCHLRKDYFHDVVQVLGAADADGIHQSGN